MSSESGSPDLPLLVAFLYDGSGYPFVAGAFFTGVFGSASQREYDALKARFGKPAVVGFFAQLDSLVEYALKHDPQSNVFKPIWTTTQPKPDPAVDLPAFVAALRSAGTAPATGFSAKQLLGKLLTPAVRDRGYAMVDRAHGAGSASEFESILGAIVEDAGKEIS